MGLAERAAAVQPKVQCRTCHFYEGLKPKDRAAFDGWLDAGRSIERLRLLCVEEGLRVCKSSFGEHVRLHHTQS
jgi:hypothetical protein